MEFQERVRSSGKAKDIISYRYEVDNTPIEVICKEFTPSNKEFPLNKAVIFLPGWSMGASVTSAKELNQSFVNNSGEKTYSIVTRTESIVSDSLFKEAEAIRCFIEDNGLKEITIAGHSEGGSKAINLISLLQDKNPGIKVKGLILLDAVGLYGQGNRELTGKFVKDTFIDTLPDNLKDQNKRLKRGQPTKAKVVKSLLNRTKSTAGAGLDLMRGIAKEVKLSRLNYSKKLTNQIQEMRRKNPRIPVIKAPIILMSGAKDPISSREKIVPKAEEDKAVQDYLKSIDSDLSKINPILRIREKYLKDNLFLQSPYIKMIIPEDFGHHGLPLFRPESIARVSLYLLERFSRNSFK